MNEILKKDLYRYENIKYGGLFLYKEIKWLKTFRKAQATNNYIIKKLLYLKLNILTFKTHIQIPIETQIDSGLYIGHIGRIIINQNAKLGKNINISTGVVIGQENRGKRKGSPNIGNEVWIGANSVIVGNINIGNDVLIAPLSYINFDVPDHSIVIGNPGRIISKENATEGYINRKV